MKRLLHTFFRLLLIAGLTQSCAAPSIHTAFELGAGEDATAERVLPTQRCADYFIVDAIIDGEGPFPMLLDTGAGTTVLSPLIAEMTGISSRMDSVQIDAFLATGSIPCVTLPVDHLSRALGTEIEGILGYSVFKGMLLTYDYPRGQIRLKPGAFSAAELEHPGMVPTSEGSRPFVRASTDTLDFTLLIDTGSSGGISIAKFGELQLAAPPKPTNGYMRINGLFVDKASRLVGDLRLGPLILERPTVKPASTVSLAGQDVLNGLVLTFDQIQHRMRFQRPNGDLSEPILFPPIYGMGAVLAPRDDRLIVRRLFEGSAAVAAGLQLDDEILSINGELIAERDCSHLESSQTSRPRSLELVIERGGERMTIHLLTAVLVD